MARKITRPWKINPVVVDWVDSTCTPGWLEESHGVKSDMRCATIGHLVNQDQEGVTLALNRSAYTHGDYIKIPRCAVKRVRKLKE